MSGKTYIYPFRGLRYQLDKVGSLANVTAPPYDVISKDGQKALYDKHAANVIRLILGEKTSRDSEQDNPYVRASQFFSQWQTEGTLSGEDTPAVYAYNQSWDNAEGHNERKGWWVLLKLEDFTTGRVLPHEFTLKGPKIDRFNLMKATLANFSPIFMIYDDPKRQLEALPLGANWQEAHDQDGTLHQIQAVTDPATIQKVQDVLADQKLLIADGHHRYETALAFKDEVRHRITQETGNIPPEGSLMSDYMMVFVTNLSDPGLKVYPTDRILYNWPEGWDADKFETALFSKFEKTNSDPDFYYQRVGDESVGIKIKDRNAMADLPEGLRQLDTAILDEAIFKGIFGEPQEVLKNKHLVGFYRDPEAVKALIQKQEAVAVFYMNTPPMGLIKSLCEAGHRMPQKSTYFYPKLLSGLVFYSYQHLGTTDKTALTGVIDAKSLDGLTFELTDYQLALVPDH